MTNKFSVGDMNWDCLLNDPNFTGAAPTVITTEQQFLDMYGKPTTYLTTNYPVWNDVYKWPYAPVQIRVPVSTFDNAEIIVEQSGSKDEVVTKAELVKYLGERKLVQENELVRKLYDRLQVAIKLARSDDDGNPGA